ncbi:hypothetical protein [Bacteroides sp. 224]|uniref:hypothetical protein n=1 Tax=Bacteroides sp. 224 TaxID=2302936 RepID=UPI0013D6121B|nr:hypothetical protein [Bacteroides sp. 224]NDV66977.1 hypothetical protein [Bacteroides sp. 224]
MKKVTILIVMLVGMLTSMNAQEFYKKQWFVSGGVNGLTALNGSANSILGGKLSGGVWLNGYTGFRVNVEAGNIWLKGDYTATTIGAGVDWMVNLLALNALDPDRKFFLNAFVGVGYNNYSLDKEYSNRYSKINDIVGNASIQFSYKLNEKLSLFAEPGIRISPKFYDVVNKDDIFVNAALSAGVIFKL